MKTVTLTETKENLSTLVEQVRHGDSILILDRGRPVARLESVEGTEEEPEGRIERLERRGLSRRARGAKAKEILSQPIPKSSPGSSILEALLADRRSTR